MQFSINPAVYAGVFTMPTAAAQKARLANDVQLRVLLAIFSQPQQELSARVLAEQLHLSAEQAEDALLFWAGEGILNQAGADAVPVRCDEDAVSMQAQEKSRTLPKVTDSLTGKPTREEAVRRGLQDEDVRLLLSEMQVKLSRTLSQQEMITVVWLHDTLGLPTPVILMLTEYAVSEGHTGIRWLEKTAIDWAQQEIDTVAKAEETLHKAAMSKKSWYLVRTSFGIEDRRASKKELEYSRVWVQEWGFGRSMLTLAYDACIDHAGKLSMPYINRVLGAWHNAGIQTPAQVKEAEQDKKPAKTAQRAGSFDYDQLNKLFE